MHFLRNSHCSSLGYIVKLVLHSFAVGCGGSRRVQGVPPWWCWLDQAYRTAHLTGPCGGASPPPPHSLVAAQLFLTGSPSRPFALSLDTDPSCPHLFTVVTTGGVGWQGAAKGREERREISAAPCFCFFTQSTAAAVKHKHIPQLYSSQILLQKYTKTVR